MKIGIGEKFTTIVYLAIYAVGFLIMIWASVRAPFSFEWLGVVFLVSSFALLADLEISKVGGRLISLEKRLSKNE